MSLNPILGLLLFLGVIAIIQWIAIYSAKGSAVAALTYRSPPPRASTTDALRMLDAVADAEGTPPETRSWTGLRIAAVQQAIDQDRHRVYRLQQGLVP